MSLWALVASETAANSTTLHLFVPAMYSRFLLLFPGPLHLRERHDLRPHASWSARRFVFSIRMSEWSSKTCSEARIQPCWRWSHRQNAKGNIRTPEDALRNERSSSPVSFYQSKHEPGCSILLVTWQLMQASRRTFNLARVWGPDVANLSQADKQNFLLGRGFQDA